jgi:molybdate transport system substrate-binding protein
VAGGNASIGFVALSQIRLLRDSTRGSCWIVPQSYYSPILQQAILLKRDVERKKAEAFLTFLREPDGVKVIRKYGYTAGE